MATPVKMALAIHRAQVEKRCIRNDPQTPYMGPTTFKAAWQRTQRTPTPGTTRELAPLTERRMRWLPTFLVSPKGSAQLEQRSLDQSLEQRSLDQSRASVRVRYPTGHCIQGRAVGTSASHTNNYRMGSACPVGQPVRRHSLCQQPHGHRHRVVDDGHPIISVIELLLNVAVADECNGKHKQC
jgi:hypothetical protein